MNGMHWAVFDTSPGGKLLTSDWPVELSFAGPRSHVSIPLSPDRLFLASDSRAYLEELQRFPLPLMVAAVNQYVVVHARLYVYSSDKSHEALIRSRMSEAKLQPPFFPDIADLVRRERLNRTPAHLIP